MVHLLSSSNIKQTICIIRGGRISHHLYVSRCVRQGGVLSQKVLSVYVDDPSDDLGKSQTGCRIDSLWY